MENSDCEHKQSDINGSGLAVGTNVQVIDDSRDGECSLVKLAEAGNTHVYEMLCRLSWHVPRRYTTTPVASLQQVATLRV